MSSSISTKMSGVALGKIAIVLGISYGNLESQPVRILLTKSSLTANREDINWERAAHRYLIELLENSDLENKLDGVTILTGYGDDNDSQVEKFKDACSALLDGSENWENKRKLDTWCVSFVSIGDKLREDKQEIDLDSSNSNWNGKYQLFLNSASSGLKKVLEEIKNKLTQEKEAAVLWCQVLLDREVTKYSEFVDKCVIKEQ